MAPLPESAGEILLMVEEYVEHYKFDSRIDNLLRTQLAPEDVLTLLQDERLEQSRDPSAMVMDESLQYVRRAKDDHLMPLVPMLKMIDSQRAFWELDEESEALLKFSAPCTCILQWLDQIQKDIDLQVGAKPHVSAKTCIHRLLREHLGGYRDGARDTSVGPDGYTDAYSDGYRDTSVDPAPHSTTFRDHPATTPASGNTRAPRAPGMHRARSRSRDDWQEPALAEKSTRASQQTSPHGGSARGKGVPRAASKSAAAARPAQRKASRGSDGRTDGGIRERIAWLNSSGGFAGAIIYEKVMEASRGPEVLSDAIILKHLKDLEEKKGKIKDPNSWVCAALRKLSGARGEKGRGRGEKEDRSRSRGPRRDAGRSDRGPTVPRSAAGKGGAGGIGSQGAQRLYGSSSDSARRKVVGRSGIGGRGSSKGGGSSDTLSIDEIQASIQKLQSQLNQRGKSNAIGSR